MVNKSIKALVAALILAQAGSIFASFNMNNCGVTAGTNVTSSGNSTCTQTPTTTISGLGGRKRGDRVQFNAKMMEQNFKNAKQLAQGKGRIYFPKAGAYAYYKLGDSNFLIATFDLAKKSQSGVSAQLQKIINAGKQANYPKSQYMTWFGVQSTAQDKAAGIFTEAGESYSSKGQNPGLDYERTGNAAVIYQNGKATIEIK